MTNISCLYPNREAALVAYLYDDLAAVERIAFETHVTTCLPCRSELADMRGVRSTLAQWVPPEPAFSLQSSVSSRQSGEPRFPGPEPRAWWHTVPVWAQVAAAMLVLGVSASIANVDIRYDRSHGLNVRTGWSKSASADVAQTAPADAAPWRAELAALRSQMQSEIHAQPATVRAASTPAPVAAVAATAATSTMSDDEFGRRVRVLLADSEKKQQKELAVRLMQLQVDVNAQLQADRGQSNQLFRDVTNTYGSQLQNQQQQIKYLQPAPGR